ncbi:MAG: DUF4838 domain-containing protein [Spirochaetaceae bacterium]|jgi:hypothetical protein|nr:DUF4838 domain-containing protein [Spirochaetaceae bacterium]
MKLTYFDVSKAWEIHIPPGRPVIKKSAEDLIHYLKLLRNQAGLSLKPPVIQDQDTPMDCRHPRIFLQSELNGPDHTGFFWHIEKSRIEICGESDRGLCNGVFDFLKALGLSWPDLDHEVLPPAHNLNPQEYLPKETYGERRAQDTPIRRRVLLERHYPASRWKSLLLWAVHNQIDTAVFSLYAGRGMRGYPHFSKELGDLVEKYALTIERGGWDLSIFVPRRYFLFNREMFRMDSGKRDGKINFCPTSPEAINLIRRKAEEIFRAYPETAVYHLWPDQGHERSWCSCPTCRAFTLEEQGRIAVSTAADVLAEINPRGRISFYEPSPGRGDIAVRPNLFKISHLPGEAGAEAEGWFSTARFKPRALFLKRPERES